MLFFFFFFLVVIPLNANGLEFQLVSFIRSRSSARREMPFISQRDVIKTFICPICLPRPPPTSPPLPQLEVYATARVRVWLANGAINRCNFVRLARLPRVVAAGQANPYQPFQYRYLHFSRSSVDASATSAACAISATIRSPTQAG